MINHREVVSTIINTFVEENDKKIYAKKKNINLFLKICGRKNTLTIIFTPTKSVFNDLRKKCKNDVSAMINYREVIATIINSCGKNKKNYNLANILTKRVFCNDSRKRCKNDN